MHSLQTLSSNSNLKWIVKLFVLLCFCGACECNTECNSTTLKSKNLPFDWPCEWNNGTIPFAFNLFSQSPKRLIGLVKTGLGFLEDMSCLRFKEHDPAVIAKMPNVTYLYFTYSGVLENCCLEFYTKPVGQRLVLITPMCTLPLEIAHVTLHGMGLYHSKQRPFSVIKAKAAMFPYMCEDAMSKAQKGYNKSKDCDPIKLQKKESKPHFCPKL